MTRPDLDELRRKISAYQQTAGSAFGEATAEEIIMCVPALLRDAEAGRKLREAVREWSSVRRADDAMHEGFAANAVEARARDYDAAVREGGG